MVRNRPKGSLWSSAALVLLGVLGFGYPVYAYHFPWDQGHDTFTPVPPDDPNPNDGDGAGDGDPVDLADGNFRYQRTRHDIRILDDGPLLELVFSYHSRDFYNGPFGRGWHSTLTSSAIKVTDGDVRHVIIRQGDGRRKRYLLNPDGSFQAPIGDYRSLVNKADGSYTLTFKGGLEHDYNTSGQLVRVKDIRGDAVIVAYDSVGAIQSAATASGRTLSFVKGANGKIATVSDPLVGDYRYEYTADGLMHKVIDPLGNETRYEYDSEMRMVRVFAPNGQEEIENTYDAKSRVTQQVLLNNTGYRYTFDYSAQGSGQVTVSRIASGLPTVTARHNFNSQGLPTTTTLPASAGGTVTRVYDAHLNLTSVTTVDGTTTYQYDERGNIVQVLFPDNSDVRFVYEPTYSRVIGVQDVTNGTSAGITYNDAISEIDIADITSASTSIPADSYGLLETNKRGLGSIRVFTGRYPLH